MSASPPRKRLPVRPDPQYLKKQAKRRAAVGDIPLSDAQHAVAREYGCRDWAELMCVVEAMNRGADQLVGARRDHHPLAVAARQRDVEAVRRILESGDYTFHDLDTGLAHAAWYGGDDPDVLAVRKTIFDLLLEHGADPDGQYGSNYGPIVFGVGECLAPHGLRWLLDAGADVAFPPVGTKYGRQCPLSSWLGTYLRGRNDSKHRGIDLLLRRGAYVPPEVTPPILAIHRDDDAALTELLNGDAGLLHRRFDALPYLDCPGGTLLHYACEFGEARCIELLLSRGADVNARSVTGVTPLHLAVRGATRREVVKLLDHGARPRLTDDQQLEPRHYAQAADANPDKAAILEALMRGGLGPPGGQDRSGG